LNYSQADSNPQVGVTSPNVISVSKWKDEIKLAKSAGIDGFTLNMASGERILPDSVANAFTAVAGTDFKFVFSFDYAALGAWKIDDVVMYLQRFGGHASYHRLLRVRRVLMTGSKSNLAPLASSCRSGIARELIMRSARAWWMDIRVGRHGLRDRTT
jgi:hypothetical protein